VTDIGRWLVGAGLVLALVGAVLWIAGRAGFRGLPGDVRIEGERYRFYFPIVTCLVVSAVLTILLWLFQRWRR
jgi:DUF2905 family protein